MPIGKPVLSVCPRTGITQPECSCTDCLVEQIRQFQPCVLNADPASEIRVSRGPGAAAERSPTARRGAV